MEIAKGFHADNYSILDLTYKDHEDWDIAINIFEKRLFDRFIEPADKLIEIEKSIAPLNRKYGFTVLALDCIIIETLQSFYEGIIDSNKMGKKLFVNFLCHKEYFRDHFNTEKKAKDFYVNYRCGLLHQAQTSEHSKIWSVGDLRMKDNNFEIINRNRFHESLKEEVDIYFQKLKSREDYNLMLNFKRKMDYISGK